MKNTYLPIYTKQRIFFHVLFRFHEDLKVRTIKKRWSYSTPDLISKYNIITTDSQTISHLHTN